MKWTRNGERIGSIDFVVSTIENDEYIRVQYTLKDRFSGESTDFDYKARLTSTPCHFGGRRWWFICPFVINGQPCNDRVGALYLADGKYFGCRHCQDLTYESSKESHQFDRMFLKMGIDPKEAKELLRKRYF